MDIFGSRDCKRFEFCAKNEINNLFNAKEGFYSDDFQQYKEKVEVLRMRTTVKCASAT